MHTFWLQCMVKTFVHQPKTLSSLYYGILSGNLQCIYTCAEFRYTLTPVWLLYVHYFIDGFLHFRVVVLDKITDYVLFLSKLLVTASVGVAAYFWFQGKVTYFSDYVPTNLNYYITPVILVIIGTFLICTCFFSVYAMAVDTLFLCFLEDLEMNDGSAVKPYFMSKGLMSILGKKNLKPGEKKKCCGCC